MSLEDIESSSYVDRQEPQTPDVEAEADNPNQEKEEQKNIGAEDSDVSCIFDNQTDKELYNEVLEKLDIVKERKQANQERFMQEKLNNEADFNNIQNLKKSQAKNQIENALASDFAKVQKLVQSGFLSSGQGQNLKKQVLKKAFDKIVQTEKIKRNLSTASQLNKKENGSINSDKVFEEFSKSNPDFFNSDGRKEVLNYLKSGGADIGKEELNKISEIIRIVEKTAIDRYLQKMSHGKVLKNSNESAKQRLTANAQKAGFTDKNLSRSFTREQIGKMNGAEFAKYEPLIMEQLKKGLIR